MTPAAIAGISQDGRSDGWSEEGRRVAGGLRAGALGMAGEEGRGAWVMVAAVPAAVAPTAAAAGASASAGSPAGLHDGVGMEVQLGRVVSGAGAAAAGISAGVGRAGGS